MLRMKSRKRTKKMRGGGIFGPVFSSHIDTAGNQASQGWGKFLGGVEVGKKVSRQAQFDAKQGYNTNIKPSGTIGGLPPKQTTHAPLAIKAMRNLSIANQGHLAPQVAAQYRDAGEGSQRTTSENPLTSSPVHTGHAIPSGNRDVRQKLQFGGKRKTKKRRRKRKKKKTKRKKRRRKRKTKKRRRKKYN